MPYIVAIPHRGDPVAWYVTDKNDYISRCYLAFGSRLRDGVLYEETTPVKLAFDFGLTPAAPLEDFIEAGAAWVEGLAHVYGWNKRLYRADYLTGNGVYRPEPVEQFDACQAWDSRDISAWYWLDDDAAARAFVDRMESDGTPAMDLTWPRRAAHVLRRVARLD